MPHQLFAKICWCTGNWVGEKSNRNMCTLTVCRSVIFRSMYEFKKFTPLLFRVQFRFFSSYCYCCCCSSRYELYNNNNVKRAIHLDNSSSSIGCIVYRWLSIYRKMDIDQNVYSISRHIENGLFRIHGWWAKNVEERKKNNR